MALAGAQWRMLNLVQHCAQNLDKDIGFCLHGLAGKTWPQLLRKTQFFMARVLTESNAPDNLKVVHGGKSSIQATGQSHDRRPDPRIAAVSLAVPVGVAAEATVSAGVVRPGAVSDGVVRPGAVKDGVVRAGPVCTGWAPAGLKPVGSGGMLMPNCDRPACSADRISLGRSVTTAAWVKSR